MVRSMKYVLKLLIKQMITQKNRLIASQAYQLRWNPFSSVAANRRSLNVCSSGYSGNFK